MDEIYHLLLGPYIGCGKKKPYKPISDLLRTTRKIFAHFRVISGKQSCLIGLNTAFCPIFFEFLEHRYESGFQHMLSDFEPPV